MARKQSQVKIAGVKLGLMMGLAIFAGCASMSPSGYRQAVLIRSEPPGAQIWVRNQEMGQTPAYVRLRRGHAPTIELKYDPKRDLKGNLASSPQTLQIPLETKYRWHDSFFSNLIFLVYAPVGWFTDILTGNAWNIQDSPVVALTPQVPSNSPAAPSHAHPLPGGIATERSHLHPPTTVSAAPMLPPATDEVTAIAPPIADSLELSDAAALALQKILQQKEARIKILDYEKTLPTFVAEGFDYDGVPDLNQQRNLFYKLRVAHVYGSKIEKRDDELILTTRPYNTLDKTYGPVNELGFNSDDPIDDVYSGRHQWLHFLPSTVTLDSVSEQMSWSLNNGQGSQRTVSLGPEHGQDEWYQILNAVSAINFTNLPARRVGRASHLQFGFVPAIHLSRRTLVASDDSLLQDTKFTRSWLSAGYGIELGWQISRHYVYLNMIPQFFWDRIDWNTAGGLKYSRTGEGFTYQLELGYLFFFNAHWNVSLFTRSFNEDNVTWGHALSNASGQADYEAGTLTRTVYGISVGYRFEPQFKLGRWVVGHPATTP